MTDHAAVVREALPYTHTGDGTPPYKDVLRNALAALAALEAALAEANAKIDRLTSRGIEDLRFSLAEAQRELAEATKIGLIHQTCESRILAAEAELAEANLSLETCKGALSGTQFVRDEYKARATTAEGRVHELADELAEAKKLLRKGDDGRNDHVRLGLYACTTPNCSERSVMPGTRPPYPGEYVDPQPVSVDVAGEPRVERDNYRSLYTAMVAERDDWKERHHAVEARLEEAWETWRGVERKASNLLDAAELALSELQANSKPIQDLELALAEMTQERDKAMAAIQSWRENYQRNDQEKCDALALAHAAELALDAATKALEHYADPRNWSVRRDPLHQYASAVWIGAGATDLPVPDAPAIARAAIAATEGTP